MPGTKLSAGNSAASKVENKTVNMVLKIILFYEGQSAFLEKRMPIESALQRIIKA